MIEVMPRAGASDTPGSLPRMLVRDLALDLDAFEGPFDLLLALVLRDEIALADVDYGADLPDDDEAVPA